MGKPELLNSKQAATLLGWPERGSKLRGMVRRFKADGAGPKGGKLFTRETVLSWADVSLSSDLRVEKHVFEAIPLFAPVPDAFRFELKYELSSVTDQRERLPRILGYLKCKDIHGWSIMRHVANWPGRSSVKYVAGGLGRFMLLDGWNRDDVAKASPWFFRLLNPRLDLTKTLADFYNL